VLCSPVEVSDREGVVELVALGTLGMASGSWSAQPA